MKSLSVLLLCALALFSTACEMHKASELEEEEPAGETHAEVKESAAAEAKPEEKKTEEGKPGEAPKFFPEKK